MSCETDCNILHRIRYLYHRNSKTICLSQKGTKIQVVDCMEFISVRCDFVWELILTILDNIMTDCRCGMS